MTRYSTKRKHRSNGNHHLYRTRVYGRDLDQIHQDLIEPEKHETRPLDPDLPGLGQHYCVECARHFASEEARQVHKRSKVHRRRLKDLKEAPYSQEEAEAAVNIAHPKPHTSSDMIPTQESNVVMAD
ncbi:zinc finger protein [Schizosaccharomyces cryophilus OY26]|uniref:Zinc finger protein n=1 Tax=Schizosaccharomyces cryophilus (strain OY26 / ATCC MYA-4695 / CBS 11777 / NBRC 106824 / NRRL Y48691) TaxID=653667 RepID=S9W269_SCHCR|nr:zinc finger protein [Schizosaccharomyces cryophilus OY26]EPY52454.1 zinc finger protein [Schizosaccharomyces cryophilus OY26]